MIRTMDEALATLRTYIPAPGMMAKNYTLDRMRQLMTLLGDPQDSYKSIHIAGTSGKTSTAYFVSGLLQTAGARVGLTVSPHMQSITERIQINGEPIADDLFIHYLTMLLEKLGQSDIKPTYFELLVALAFLVFREEKVEYAVVETGLGGLLDGTNIITRPDKVCAITDIGLDHTDVLGSTVEAIALQKAGIVQPGATLVLQHQDKAVERTITEEAYRRGAKEVVAVPVAAYIAELPGFQRRNWAIAMAAYTFVADRDHLTPLLKLDSHDAMLHQPPGRMEIITVHGKTVVMDGAHNPQKLHALVGSLQDQGYTSVAVLASFVSDKRDLLESNLRELQPITRELIVTDFSVVRDIGKSASSATEIVAVAKQLGFQSVKQITHPQEALAYLLSLSDQVALVTGSLYLVAQLRSQLLND